MQECPKQDRCKYGLNCPREYIPQADFLCFENWESKRYKECFHENYRPWGEQKKTQLKQTK